LTDALSDPAAWQLIAIHQKTSPGIIGNGAIGLISIGARWRGESKPPRNGVVFSTAAEL